MHKDHKGWEDPFFATTKTTKGDIRLWVHSANEGPWTTASSGDYWYIYNILTSESKRVGPIESKNKKRDYFDTALGFAKVRNYREYTSIVVLNTLGNTIIGMHAHPEKVLHDLRQKGWTPIIVVENEHQVVFQIQSTQSPGDVYAKIDTAFSSRGEFCTGCGTPLGDYVISTEKGDYCEICEEEGRAA